MSAKERRKAIVGAALPLFAKNGFANTTTKELAAAAGVSEALLYKHFSSKEALYAEIQKLGGQDHDPALEKIRSMPPSTSTLVQLVSYLVRYCLMGRPDDSVPCYLRNRLVLNRCLESGDFRRFLLQNCFASCFAKMLVSLEAAETAGDLVTVPISIKNRLIFAHFFASMLGLAQIPQEPVKADGNFEELLHQAVWFVLRGLGLKDKAIAINYNPKSLSV